MANETPNLGLILPAKGEYTDTWNVPVNDNFSIIDSVVGAMQAEAIAAAGSQPDLATRLAVGMNADGSLIATPEVVSARDSSIYGYAIGANNFQLNDRIEQGDREVFNARQSLASLSAVLAFGNDDNVANSVVSAPTGFLSFTGANVKVDGSVTPVVCNINGFRQVVRTLESVAVSGAAGTYYIYLAIQAGGDVYLDNTAPANNTGATAIYPTTGLLQMFTDVTQNFVTLGVQPGDVLDITTTGSVNANRYVVLATNIQDPTNLTVNQIAVISVFSSSQSNLNYKLTNLISPSLNVTATPHPLRFVETPGQIYIGRAVFDGTNVTSTFSYALKGRFEQFFSITLSGGDFLQTIAHQLGYFPTKISFYGSQVNDYSQPMDPLSIAEADGGSTTLGRSVITNFDDRIISVKNSTNGLFYTTFAEVSQVSGYLLVRAER